LTASGVARTEKPLLLDTDERTDLLVDSNIELAEYVEENSEELPDKSEDENMLSLQKNEREIIQKALEKNKGKRKQTAIDLEISERTLYRKLKEFGLDG